MNNIISSLEFGVLRLSLNRMAKRNALNVALCQELTQALEETSQNTAVRVVILQSEPDVFSAGADMEETQKKPQELDEALSALFAALNRFPKTIIASVKGPCVAEGLLVVLYADLVYASQDALFSFPATALARTPRFGAISLFTKTGMSKLLSQKVLLSEPISVEEAFELGWISGVTEPDALDKVVAEKAARLAVLPPKAVQLTKELLREKVRAEITTSWETHNALYQSQSSSPEAKETLQAFLEGRKPSFK